jgi:predicted DNA-binding protein YlxM (UPF0122 family)
VLYYVLHGIETIEMTKFKRMDADQQRWILQQYEQGLKVSAIASELNVDKSTIYNVLKRNDVKPTRNDDKTFPLEIQDKIIALYSQGTEVKVIANELGVDYSSVFNVLNRRGIELKRWDNKTWRKYQIGREDYFEVIDSEEKAYFLGYLMADGYVQGDRRVGMSLQARDIEVLEYLKAAIQSTAPIKPKVAKLRGKEFPQVQFAMCSIRLTQDLARWGIIERKSWNAVYPELPDDPKLHAGFIRGFWDGDGSVIPSTKIISISGTHLMIQSVAATLTAYADASRHNRIRPHAKSPSSSELRYSHRGTLKAIYEFLYQDATVFLKRKHQRWIELLSSYRRAE